MLWMCLLWGSTALADAIGPPPECPDGQVGVAAHDARCAPATCDGETCAEGSCFTTGMCVLTEERPCGSDASNTTCTFTRVEAFGLCDIDADCPQGDCVVDGYCFASGKPGGCGGCSTTVGASAVGVVGLLPLLLGITRRRLDIVPQGLRR